MFSGIISSIGQVLEVRDAASAVGDHGLLHRERLILMRTNYSDLSLGESVAVNGACLTVAHLEELNSGTVHFFVSAETLKLTTLGKLTKGASVNLERALQLDGRLSGHLVSGHIDGTARLKSRYQESASTELVFELPPLLARDCIQKGSITIEGISLTINQITENAISVRIIPHTWSHTTLQYLKVNDEVNIETDLVVKNIRHLMSPYLNSLGQREFQLSEKVAPRL